MTTTYIARLVVLGAVGKHQSEVIYTLLAIHIVERLQALPDCPHVHRIGYHLVVVLAFSTTTQQLM